jgi:hypothetical protein
VVFNLTGLYHNDATYGNCKNVTWNPVGESMMFEDFDKFPIFVITNQTEVDILIHDVSLMYIVIYSRKSSVLHYCVY